MAFGDGDYVEGKYSSEEERLELVNNCTDACNYEYMELKPEDIPLVRKCARENSNLVSWKKKLHFFGCF